MDEYPCDREAFVKVRMCLNTGVGQWCGPSMPRRTVFLHPCHHRKRSLTRHIVCHGAPPLTFISLVRVGAGFTTGPIHVIFRPSFLIYHRHSNPITIRPVPSVFLMYRQVGRYSTWAISTCRNPLCLSGSQDARVQLSALRLPCASGAVEESRSAADTLPRRFVYKKGTSACVHAVCSRWAVVLVAL